MDMGRHITFASKAPTLSASDCLVSDEDMAAEVDEPPDHSSRPCKLADDDFQKTKVRKPCDQQSSLLTKALSGQPEDESVSSYTLKPHSPSTERRRSTASNASVASTVDLTSDTGLTSASRATTPSPPHPEIRLSPTHRLDSHPHGGDKLRFGQLPIPNAEQRAEAGPRKKSITFACLANPASTASNTKPQQHQPPEVKSTVEAPRRTCIKFVCPAPRDASDSTAHNAVGKPPGNSARRHRSPRPSITWRASKDAKPAHGPSNEATYDEPREDDWIREDDSSPKGRLTIKDTLVKENHIRQLTQEAEEEDEQGSDNDDDDNDDDDNDDDGEDDEDDLEDLDGDDDNDDDDDDGEDEDADEDGDEDETDYHSIDGDDGYHTDEETGFAESDEDESDGLNLWNHGIQLTVGPSPQAFPLQRRPSATDHHSDSSTGTQGELDATRGRKSRRRSIRPVTPELPDSTDFVCGTFDEDREREEAYLSHRAARKAKKLHIIPQDIDPSFPTSDIEDGDGEELFNPVHHDSEDEIWEMEDVGGNARDRKKAKCSPKRYHSPPPPVKARGRSPRLGFDKHSPRRAKSPAPKKPASSRAAPVLRRGFAGQGAGAGLPQTKSLPRPSAMLPLAKNSKRSKLTSANQHVRGAIDIVKGLEEKRQRRKEKYYQKYCNRARKGQVPERKRMPGQGAHKMRELGLLMAGKTDRGNYVLSI